MNGVIPDIIIPTGNDRVLFGWAHECMQTEVYSNKISVRISSVSAVTCNYRILYKRIYIHWWGPMIIIEEDNHHSQSTRPNSWKPQGQVPTISLQLPSASATPREDDRKRRERRALILAQWRLKLLDVTQRSPVLLYTWQTHLTNEKTWRGRDIYRWAYNTHTRNWNLERGQGWGPVFHYTALRHLKEYQTSDVLEFYAMDAVFNRKSARIPGKASTISYSL